MPVSARSSSSFSTTSSTEHHPLSPTRAARHSQSSSNDSTESLRNLELSDGPMTATNLSPGTRHGRQRSFSFTGFDFQRDLLPLSASVSEPDASFVDAPGSEKSISLIHSACLFSCLSSFFAVLLDALRWCQVLGWSLDYKCVSRFTIRFSPR
jgi:hypothetical protein